MHWKDSHLRCWPVLPRSYAQEWKELGRRFASVPQRDKGCCCWHHSQHGVIPSRSIMAFTWAWLKKKPRGRYDDFTVPNHVKTCWIKICMCISHAHMSIMVYPQKMDRVTADISIQLILRIQNRKHKNLPWPVQRRTIYYTQFPFVTKKGINVAEFRHRMLHHQRFPYFSPVIQRGNWKNKKHSSSHLVRWFSQRTKPPFGSRISSQPRLTTPYGIPNCWLLLVV
jgi:hypothetical protein